MSVITIQDFSGMMPLRDGILLPDRNAQYAKNTWLYKGSIRGFRHAIPVHIATYADTQQVYRIPDNTAQPPNFVTSLWLEFPDQFMATIRNPVVGDQWNRYYFFPSDQYNSTGANPDWPITKPPPKYRTYDPATQTVGPLYTLGIPAPDSNDPTKAPVVVPAPVTVVKTATADVAAGGTTLTLDSTTDLSDGMTITDISNTPITTTTLYTTPPNSHPIDTQTTAATNPASGGGAYHTYQTSAAASAGGNVLAMQ